MPPAPLRAGPKPHPEATGNARWHSQAALEAGQRPVA